MSYLRDLRIVDAMGGPTVGETFKPWALDFMETVFGSYDEASGRRLIKEYFLVLSKKNGKSTLASAVMITALLMNWRNSAEFFILAPTVEVANNSFEPARDMVRSGIGPNDPLDVNDGGFLKVQEHTKTIIDLRTGSKLKVLAADSATVSGKKATGVFVDELWQFGKRANSEAMLREALGGLVSRPEGFVIYASTHSDEPPEGVYKKKLNYFRDVRDGKIVDKKSLPYLFEFPRKMIESEEYLDRKWWFVTNPNIGVSVDEEWIADELQKAQSDDKGALALFAAKHLNVEIGISLGSDRWRGSDFWVDAVEPGLSLDDIIARCDVVTCGVDGGGNDDLYGFSVIGRERGDGDIRFRRWLVWNHTWVSTQGVAERKSENAKYDDFVKAGELTIVKNLDDAEIEISDIVTRLDGYGLLPEVAVGLDPYGCKSLTDKLACVGFGVDRLAAVQQGYKLNGVIIDVERRLTSKTLIHGGQSIMAWSVGNAKVEVKGNALLITKQASGRAKIDPLMALLDAAHLMGNHPEPSSRRSIYDAGELWEDGMEEAVALSSTPAFRPSIYDAVK